MQCTKRRLLEAQALLGRATHHRSLHRLHLDIPEASGLEGIF
jgi:hypothetical protein